MSKKQKPAEEVEVNDEMVVAAATDINTVLAPNPLLDLEKPGEELQKEIEELFPNIMKGDALSKETWTTLTALGWKVAEPPKIEKPKASKPEMSMKVSKAAKVPKAAKGPSNKEIIYNLWAKGKGETDPAKLGKKVKDAVKTTTIKSWISSWNRGQNLPGCASK